MNFRTSSLASLLIFYAATVFIVLFPLYAIVVAFFGIFSYVNYRIIQYFQDVHISFRSNSESVEDYEFCAPAVDYIAHCAA